MSKTHSWWKNPEALAIFVLWIPCVLLLHLKPDAETHNIKERGYKGSQDSAVVPGFRIPNVSSGEGSTWERKLPLLISLQSSGREDSKDSELASEGGSIHLASVTAQLNQDVVYGHPFCLPLGFGSCLTSKLMLVLVSQYKGFSSVTYQLYQRRPSQRDCS